MIAYVGNMNIQSSPAAPAAAVPAPSAGETLGTVESLRVELARITRTLIISPSLVDEYDVHYLAALMSNLDETFTGYLKGMAN